MAQKATNSNLDLVDLDFYSLKNSFKNFLKGQAQFKDFDFAGSSMSVLLDLLAYNTTKLAFYQNMTLAERFFDSAVLRNSLLSHAKELNYLPRSVRSSVAKIDVTFQATGENSPYIIQKGSQFSTMIKSAAYTFTIPETIIVASANSTFQFETDIYEGPFVKDSYVFQDNVTNQRFKITNKNVDTRSITVTVFEDGNLVGDNYQYKQTLLDLTESDKVFFLQTSETGNYEIIFGDDIIGRQPKAGSTIVMDYRVSKGPLGDGARSFSVDFDPTGLAQLTSTPLLEVIEASHNGQDQETDDSIRYYAPRAFQTQERTVVTPDYVTALKAQFPEINAVTVFGGEEISPPRFGRVFISVDISDVEGLPESKKDEYGKFLQGRMTFGLLPIFMEPEFLYLRVEDTVRYNVNITNSSPNRILTIVLDTITSFNRDFLNDFDVTMRQSELSAMVDESEVSILSNIMKVTVYKKFIPVTNVTQNIDINFHLALNDQVPMKDQTYLPTDYKVITTSNFTFKGELCQIEDDGNGILRIVKSVGDKKQVIVNTGTVDYSTGLVKLVDFNPDSYEGNAIKMYAALADEDIIAPKNNLLTLENDEVHLTIEQLRE